MYSEGVIVFLLIAVLLLLQNHPVAKRIVNNWKIRGTRAGKKTSLSIETDLETGDGCEKDKIISGSSSGQTRQLRERNSMGPPTQRIQHNGNGVAFSASLTPSHVTPKSQTLGNDPFFLAANLTFGSAISPDKRRASGGPSPATGITTFDDDRTDKTESPTNRVRQSFNGVLAGNQSEVSTPRTPGLGNRCGTFTNMKRRSTGITERSTTTPFTDQIISSPFSPSYEQMQSNHRKIEHLQRLQEHAREKTIKSLQVIEWELQQLENCSSDVSVMEHCLKLRELRSSLILKINEQLEKSLELQRLEQEMITKMAARTSNFPFATVDGLDAGSPTSNMYLSSPQLKTVSDTLDQSFVSNRVGNIFMSESAIPQAAESPHRSKTQPQQPLSSGKIETPRIDCETSIYSEIDDCLDNMQPRNQPKKKVATLTFEAVETPETEYLTPAENNSLSEWEANRLARQHPEEFGSPVESIKRSPGSGFLLERSKSGDLQHFSSPPELNQRPRSSSCYGSLTQKKIKRSSVRGGSPRNKQFKWKKGDLIGTGGFGTVHIAMIESDGGKIIAVKNVPVGGDGPGKHGRLIALKNEIELMKSLEHVNIVQYKGTEREGESLNIFMEFVSGGSIASVLKMFGPLTEKVVVAYTWQVLCGLQYLHSNKVIHRDIKGANILLTVDGVCKLADFGAATLCTNDRIHTSLIGTPNWMPPEVIKQEGHTESADVWSLGCTVLEMLTGAAPWSKVGGMQVLFFITSDTPIAPKVVEATADLTLDGGAHEFLMSCLQRNPTSRLDVDSLLAHPWMDLTEDEDEEEFESPEQDKWVASVNEKTNECLMSLGSQIPNIDPINWCYSSDGKLTVPKKVQRAPDFRNPSPSQSPKRGTSQRSSEIETLLNEEECTAINEDINKAAVPTIDSSTASELSVCTKSPIRVPGAAPSPQAAQPRVYKPKKKLECCFYEKKGSSV
eukprot:TRINITY_DN4798_c4_g1_i2.p1 TRINITY_DN4798_c4_g1~~TRINITY_DN4798_c4_g1_i2.p1  ORF type:complete len:971 (+),score=182.95 TRINITY_DN4798_c4_g1_i2:46-2913(+)